MTRTSLVLVRRRGSKAAEEEAELAWERKETDGDKVQAQAARLGQVRNAIVALDAHIFAELRDD